MFVKVLRRTPSRSWTRCWWRSSRSGRPPSPWANREWGSSQLQSRRRRRRWPKRGFYWTWERVTCWSGWWPSLASPTRKTCPAAPFRFRPRSEQNVLVIRFTVKITMLRYRQIVPAASPGVLEAECSEGHLDLFPCSHTDLVGLVLDDQTNDKSLESCFQNKSGKHWNRERQKTKKQTK